MLTFFTIDGEMITEMLGYTADIFSDISPIILLIIGVSLAMLVISTIIGSLRG